MMEENILGALGILIKDRLDQQMGDLSPSAAAILSMLHFKPGLTGSQLAEILAISQPTAVRVINGLEAQDLLQRCETDGKATPLMLTERGQKQATSFQASRLSSLQALMAPLSPEEKGLFADMLARIVASATTSRAFAKTTCRFCEHDLCGPEICPIGCAAGKLEAAKDPNSKTEMLP